MDREGRRRLARLRAEAQAEQERVRALVETEKALNEDRYSGGALTTLDGGGDLPQSSCDDDFKEKQSYGDPVATRGEVLLLILLNHRSKASKRCSLTFANMRRLWRRFSGT